jgi:hypothetical protein
VVPRPGAVVRRGPPPSPIAAPAELFLARRAAARRLRALALAARRLAAFEARWRRRVALAKLPRTCWASTLTGAAPGCPGLAVSARAGVVVLPVACLALDAPPSSCTRVPISTPPNAIAAAASAPTARDMLLRACIGAHCGTPAHQQAQQVPGQARRLQLQREDEASRKTRFDISTFVDGHLIEEVLNSRGHGGGVDGFRKGRHKLKVVVTDPAAHDRISRTFKFRRC